VADVEDIYDEFSFGEKSPQAVKDFLLYAAGNWKTKPRYALLVGDASHDPKNYLSFGDWDLVPTKLIDTGYMEAASDDWFADFNSDGAPELAVGRLPARNSEEAERMVAKIISYDQGAAANETLLVADANDGYNFGAVAAELGRLVPEDIRVIEIDRGRSGVEAKQALIDAINRGQRIVNYTGHGAADAWRGNLLTSEDAGALINRDHLSLFVMMTCLNGYFDDPTRDSLAEALIKAPGGGAVAVWASSAMTLPTEQALMNQELYRQLFGGHSPSLGDAVLAAKAAIIDRDVRRTWILLGDPTFKLK
jgi:hypothetical protein